MANKLNKTGFNNLTISILVSGLLLTGLIIFSVGFFIQSKNKNRTKK